MEHVYKFLPSISPCPEHARAASQPRPDPDGDGAAQHAAEGGAEPRADAAERAQDVRHPAAAHDGAAGAGHRPAERGRHPQRGQREACRQVSWQLVVCLLVFLS